MENKNEVSYLKNIKCADVYTESQADYTLPEYQADVRKILFSRVTLRPSGRFAGGEEVEFSGVAVYNVVYLDAEGGIGSAEFTSDYDYSVKCSSDSYKDSVADTRVASFAVRLVGPRKMSAKASLVGSVRITECGEMTVSGDGFSGSMSAEVDTVMAKIRQSLPSAVCEREYAELVTRLDGAISDEVSVVYSEGEATVDSLEASEDSVLIKGKLRMTAVIKNGDAPAFTAEKQVSFEESVELSGVTPSMELIPDLQVTSIKPSVNADESGVEVVMSGIVELCVIAEGNSQIELIRDGFLTDCPTDNSYESFNYSTFAALATEKGTHSGEISRAELECEGLRDVIFLTSTPKIESVEQADGVVTVLGEVRYSGVASEDFGDSLTYTGIKFSSPFAVNVNIDCQNCDKIQLEPTVRAYDARTNVDAEKLYATCTLETSVLVTEEKSLSVLSSMTRMEGESYKSEGAKITVYYPTKDETLFSVAKRFHTSTVKVAKDNDITESVFSEENPGGILTGVKKLIIY